MSEPVAPPPPPSSPPAAQARPAGSGIFLPAAVVGVVAVLVGAFAPWATTELDLQGPGGIKASQGGMDADGGITLALGVIAAAMVGLIRTRPARWQDVILGVSAALLVVVAVIDLNDVRDASAGVLQVAVGWGLWLTLLGALLLAIAAVLRLGSKPRPPVAG